MRSLLPLAFAFPALLGCSSAPPKAIAPPPVHVSEVRNDPARLPLTNEQITKEILRAQADASRVSIWRKWAADGAEPVLQSHALAELAWIDDGEAVALAANALADGGDRPARKVAAQVLVFYGAPRANSAKGALLAALKGASEEPERAELVWALVTLGERGVFAEAMELLRKGTLSKVERLGGGRAFDPEKLMALASIDELFAFRQDKSAAVREVVALELGRLAEPKWIDALTEMLGDGELSVASAAAGGLARIQDKRAQEALFKALRGSEGDSRSGLLQGVSEIAGAQGLVLALGSVEPNTEEAVWFQTKQIFDMLHTLADPRGADALVKWASVPGRHKHWLGEVGIRLAEVGDVRAAKLLGERLRIDPAKLYAQEKFWEADQGGHLSRTDLPRVVSARMLADLATIYPDKQAELKAAEDGVIFWLKDRPQPHANGLRFLAAVGSDKARADMRAWAFPTDPLPKPGDMPPFPEAFETAQTALRYIGAMRDKPSFSKLLAQLDRKTDKKLDITQEGLTDGSHAMLGMALRAIGYGAATGLGEWGDGRAIQPLMKFIEDEKWHEEARFAACEALAWCVDGGTMIEVAKKSVELVASKDIRKATIGACYAATLSMRPSPAIVLFLADRLELASAYGRAIGISGVVPGSEGKIFEKLKNPESRNAAAIALIMGGSAEAAARAVATMAGMDENAIERVRDAYYSAFGFWTDVDFKDGAVYRWVANAESVSHVEVAGASQEWPATRLERQLENVQYDNGPHSVTRVVLRHWLYKDALQGGSWRWKRAIATLKLMKEQGVLMALVDEKGEIGETARRALFEVRNPKPVVVEDSVESARIRR